MTLRARLLFAAGAILVVVVAGAALLLRSQQHYLVGQLDDQLRAARPFFRLPANIQRTPPRMPTDAPDEPISKLYVGETLLMNMARRGGGTLTRPCSSCRT